MSEPSSEFIRTEHLVVKYESSAAQEQPPPLTAPEWGVQKDVTPLLIVDVENWIPPLYRENTSDLIQALLLDAAMRLVQLQLPEGQRNNVSLVRARLVADIEARNKLGIARYGTPLRSFNGRNATIDQYQEILDALQYGRQDKEERDERRRIGVGR